MLEPLVVPDFRRRRGGRGGRPGRRIGFRGADASEGVDGVGRAYRRADQGFGQDVVEDVADQGCRCLCAVAALVDDGEDEVLRVGVGTEGDEPPVGLEPAERSWPFRSCRPGSTRPGNPEVGVCRPPCRVTPSRPRAWRCSWLGRWPRARSPSDDVLTTLPVTGSPRRGPLRGGSGPAVGGGRVRHRLLDGRQHRLALAEGHFDVVTGEPRRCVGKPLGASACNLPRTRTVDPSLRLAGQVDAGDTPLAVLGGLGWMASAPYFDRSSQNSPPGCRRTRRSTPSACPTRRRSRRCHRGRRAACSRCRSRHPGRRAARHLEGARVVVARVEGVIRPSWRAAVAVASLKVEPGVY